MSESQVKISRRAFAVLAATITLGLMIGIAGYHLWPRKANRPDAQRQFDGALSSMKAQVTHPHQSFYAEARITEIIDIIQGDQDVQKTVDILQAGVFYFDTQTDIKWDAEGFNRLGLNLVEYLQRPKKTAIEKKAHLLAFHLAKRVIPYTGGSEIAHLIDKALHRECDKNQYACIMFIEIGSLSRHVPHPVLDRLDRCLGSNDLGLANSCLAIGEALTDERAKDAFVRQVTSKYDKMKSPLKPFAARVIFAYRQRPAPLAQQILAEAAKSNEETWQYVFLFGVTEMGMQRQYAGRLRELAANGTNPWIQSRSRQMLVER